MKPVAQDVFQIPLMPRDGINAYLVGDVLVDAGMKSSVKTILSAVQDAGITLAAHVITHAHTDHVGGTPRIIDETDVPVSVGALDRPACESGRAPVGAAARKPLLGSLVGAIGGFDGFTVDATMTEGDEIGCDFVVLDTPGHTAGHVSLWRERDRVLICGDVFLNMNLLTTRVGLHQPPGLVTPDPARNRESERRLAALEPDVVCFGHGPVLRDAAPVLRAFVDALPGG